MNAGALPIVNWMVPEKATEAHAFDARPGFVFRSLCELARWTVKAEQAKAGPLCPVCVQTVRNAANHVLDVITELGWEETKASLEALVGAPEGEQRAMWGNR